MSSIGQIKASKVSSGAYVTNDAAVGTNITFDPERFLAGGIAKWVDRSGGFPLGYRTFTMQLRPPTKDSRVYKLTCKLQSPVLETIDPAVGIFGPRLAYTLSSFVDHIIPERATSTERSEHANVFRSMYYTLINASDGAPSDVSGSPIMPAITLLEDVY